MASIRVTLACVLPNTCLFEEAASILAFRQQDGLPLAVNDLHTDSVPWLATLVRNNAAMSTVSRHFATYRMCTLDARHNRGPTVPRYRRTDYSKQGLRQADML